jgi:alkyl sulfatase BDS1-like metallo-beta-lactamase superfamily hydrolase
MWSDPVSGSGPASAHTCAAHAEATKELPFEDREDFEDARRGLIESAPSLVLRDARGRAVWDMDSYAFVRKGEGAVTRRGGARADAPKRGARADEPPQGAQADEPPQGAWADAPQQGAQADEPPQSARADAEGESAEDTSQAPDTVHPGLWRMAQLNGIHGLFEVVPGIYQVRGYDLSNMTLVEGTRGVIVIDPLVSTECAAAALALYRKHRGEREVSAVVYTHSHVDHFGGVKGVVSAEQVQAGEVPVWAPAGFLEHAVSENVLAGGAMARRASYMFAPALERGPRGQVDAGIGKTISSGSITLIPPTHEVSHTGQEAEIDGVPIVFQLVPDSEAPAEMNFFFKDLGVLCIAENAVHCMHNVLTPRGAPVRDSLAWSKYLGEAIELFGARSDVMFAQHHWPRWGKARIVEHLARHRDMYRYLHDQTLRLANRGLTPTEIAAEVRLPPSLQRTWSCRGYYGTVSHNVRAVYQRYLGFFDGNPAHLDPYPPVEAARRYVELAGGIDKLLAQARIAFREGDYRWAAELCSHAVFAEQGCSEAGDAEAGNAETGDAETGDEETGNAESGDAETGDAETGNAESGDAEAGNAEAGNAEAGNARLGYAEARELQASALEQLGYQSESAVWRNLYLVGAHELREGPPPPPKGRRVASADVAKALSLEQLWDAMGARLDGPRAWDTTIKLAWDFTDVGERWSVTVENGALSAVEGRLVEDCHAKVTLTRAALDAVLLGEGDGPRLFSSGAIAVEGDGAKLGEFLGLLDEGDPVFAIVAPGAPGKD